MKQHNTFWPRNIKAVKPRQTKAKEYTPPPIRDWTACSLCAALVFLSPAVPATAAAMPFLVRVESTPPSTHLELEFSDEIHCTSNTPAERELLLQCDRTIDPPPMENIVTEAGGYIAWISNGYDTLLIHAARDLDFTVSTPAANRIIIDMTFAVAKPTSETSVSLRELLLESRLLAATGKPDQAAALLRQALGTYPTDGQLLSELAELELRSQRWRRAVDLFSRSLLVQPRNEDLIALRSKVLREHGSSISYESTSRNVEGDRSELLTSASASWALSIPTKLGVKLEQNHFRALDGSQEDASTQIRSRIETSIQHDFLNGSVFSAALVTGAGSGGRLSYTQSGTSGSTRLEASYGIPFWDLLTSLERHGVKDRIGFGRTQQLSARMTSQFNASFNRYRVVNAVLEQTYSLNGGINYAIRTSYPAVEIDYLFDMEKRADHLQPGDFPLLNRNVHSLGAAASAPFGRKTDLIASGGMSFDLDGGRGPFIAARFTRHLTEWLSAEVWTERRQNSVLTGRVVTSLGGRIVFAFRGKDSP